MLAVLNVLGSMLMLFSVTYVLPMITAVIYRDGLLVDFLYAAVLCFGVGAIVYGATLRHRRELRSRDGFLLVTLIWVLMSVIATVPLLIALPGLSFTDAFFESMSGLTTTGATVLTGLDSLAPSLNMWRASLHWYGGMGIIVLAVAILPLLGVGGMQLYKAETPGPIKNEKLTPRITQTAKALWFVYVLITLACIGALKLAGMSWFDAVFHAFSTLSLGGFSNYDASIAHFDSLGIELILVFFMLVSALNFSRHFIAWQQKSIRTYLTDVEATAMLRLLSVSIVVVSLYIWIDGVYPDFPTALRHTAFNVVAMATTCGYATQDYGSWPIFAPMIIVMLSCYTCNTGSTGGGIKMFRTLVLFRQAVREMMLLVHPQAVTPVKIRNQVVANHVVFAVLAFVVLYF
ncbi:MAG TPA: potassium transporter TrkG, partial [Steroidobacteraceae bacterium]|nr:potassium transporter TrkG [Steroidobacteraceae bacterium]